MILILYCYFFLFERFVTVLLPPCTRSQLVKGRCATFKAICHSHGNGANHLEIVSKSSRWLTNDFSNQKYQFSPSRRGLCVRARFALLIQKCNFMGWLSRCAWLLCSNGTLASGTLKKPRTYLVLIGLSSIYSPSPPYPNRPTHAQRIKTGIHWKSYKFKSFAVCVHSKGKTSIRPDSY